MPSWKLSASNIGWTKEEDEQVWQLMKDLGYQGLEIAPTRVFPQEPYAQLSGITLFAAVMYQKYGFVIPSMQSIWFGKSASIYDEEGANELADYTVEAFEFAKACHCPSLVFGCPRNRNVPEGRREEEADAFFEKLAYEASLRGVHLALEANPPVYNTNFMNTTAQAAALVRRLGRDKISIVGVSVVGAVFHNVGQLLVASLLVQTGGLMFYAFVLMFSAVITGTLTGLAGKQIIRVLKIPGAEPGKSGTKAPPKEGS